jgi:undecaprenyl-diphosphatase
MRQILREIDSLDRAVYRAIAQTATPTLDHDLRVLSRSADHSVLWLSIAGALAVVPGRPRRAALLAAASIGVASVSVNAVAKMLLRRKRPDRITAAVPVARRVRMPHSTSFPSGHSASAFAFASAVGTQLPRIALPLQLLAAAVAYSRVPQRHHRRGQHRHGLSRRDSQRREAPRRCRALGVTRLGRGDGAAAAVSGRRSRRSGSATSS